MLKLRKNCKKYSRNKCRKGRLCLEACKITIIKRPRKYFGYKKDKVQSKTQVYNLGVIDM